MSDPFKNHDRKLKAGMGAFAVVWVLGALLSLAMTVLVIWGLWEGIMWLRGH